MFALVRASIALENRPSGTVSLIGYLHENNNNNGVGRHRRGHRDQSTSATLCRNDGSVGTKANGWQHD